MTAGGWEGLRRIMRELRALDRLAGNRLRELRRPRRHAGPPTTFATYRDRADRFEFSYPAEWNLKHDSGVCAFSRTAGSFARVDVMPEARPIWADLRREIEKQGGHLALRLHEGRSPERASGHLMLGRLAFAWTGFAWRVDSRKVVLSLGDVVDARRSRAIERYEDRVFASIRRHFKVGPGLRP